MIDSLTRNWWLVALRGLVAILFGLAAFVWPGMTLTALIYLFGAFALVGGAFAIAAALWAAGAGQRFWALLLDGVLGVVAGVIAFAYPGITALALLYVIAFWAIVSGVAEIAAAIELRRVITNEWLLGLAGLASIVLGVLLVAFPREGALSVLWVIGAYALIFGVLQIALAFRLRSFGQGHVAMAG
jgi:uncharacterized membrane protein HdeD (DUF308 family)